MKYVSLASIDKPVSRLVYGTNGYMGGNDVEAAIESLDLAWSLGFTVFDTANCYGNSESNIGAWMQRRGLRDKVVVLDKGCNPRMVGSTDVMSPQLLYDQTAESCRRLQTDYLDMYVLHRDDPAHPVEPIIDTLNDLKDRGVIHRFGASNWTRERIAEANAYAEAHGLQGFTIADPAYNLAKSVADPWGGSVHMCGAEHQADRDWYAAHNIPIFPYSSLGRGFFSGKYRTDRPIGECLPTHTIKEYDTPDNRRRLAAAEKMAAEKGLAVSQICLAYLLSQPFEVFPIINPSKKDHIIENIGALDVILTPEELRILECE